MLDGAAGLPKVTASCRIQLVRQSNALTLIQLLGLPLHPKAAALQKADAESSAYKLPAHGNARRPATDNAYIRVDDRPLGNASRINKHGFRPLVYARFRDRSPGAGILG